jgi:VanZ like protein
MSDTSAPRGDEPRGSPNEPRGSSPRVHLHLCAFVVLLGLMTWKLLEPRPVPESVARGLTDELLFFLAKCFHAVAYAFMAVLGATLPAPRRWRALSVGVMAVHAVGTELAQYLMDVGRTGKVTDVLIDWAGITAGVLALRWWRRRPA